MAAASVGVAMPPRMPPRMMTGMSRARKLDLKEVTIRHRLRPPSPFGRPMRRPMAAMKLMQNRQMSSPGRIPAANSPAIDTPMSEP